MSIDELRARRFYEYTLPMGGAVPTEAVPPSLISPITGTIASCTEAGVHVGFVNARDVNAVAFCSDGHEFIAVTTGALHHLSTAAVLVAQCMDPFATEEAVNRAAYREVKRVIDGKVPWPTEPVLTPHQASIAAAIYVMGANYVVLHEFAHFASGHIAYLVESTGSETVALYESQPDLAIKDQPIDRQERIALEIDADTDAISWALEMVFSRSHDLDSSLVADVEKRCILMDVALSILFFKFMLSTAESIDAYSGYHPHPLVREVIARKTMLSFLDVNADRHALAQLERWFEE